MLKKIFSELKLEVNIKEWIEEYRIESADNLEAELYVELNNMLKKIIVTKKL